MKLTYLSVACCAGALMLPACKPAQSEDTAAPVAESSAGGEVDMEIKDGAVRLRLMPPVAERYACIIPIRVENGLEESVSVTMIGFDVIGPGDDAGGNMFAPVAEPGEMSEARVIVEGQSCDAFDTLRIPEILCKSGEETCEEKVELIDGGGLRFSQAG